MMLLPWCETVFCRSLDLIEYTSPATVVRLYRLMVGSMNLLATSTGRMSMTSHWLTLALQRLIISGNQATTDLAITHWRDGITAPHDSAAYWRARWAQRYFLPYLPGMAVTV